MYLCVSDEAHSRQCLLSVQDSLIGFLRDVHLVLSEVEPKYFHMIYINYVHNAMVWLRIGADLLPLRFCSNVWPVCVSSVVDKLALGQGFSQYFCFTLSLIFRQCYLFVSTVFTRQKKNVQKLGNF